MVETIIHTGLDDNPKIYFLSGLPASGKSTWAKNFASKNPMAVVINKDTYRPLFGKFSQENEVLVRATTRAAGMQALNSGRDLVVDDTNLVLKYRNFWESYAVTHENSMIHLNFDTPIDICIERDAIRTGENKVGEERIREMYSKYIALDFLNSIIEYRKQDETLPKAIIVDIDGTLAMANGRGAFDDSLLHTDIPNKPIIDLVHQLSLANKVIITSGRMATDEAAGKTLAWLYEHLDCEFILYMRKNEDTRKDSIVKREIFETYIEPSWNISLVIDDRNQVVDMWRKELQLPCLQVNYGNF